MSYLVLPAGIPDFTKAIISFWFRVPQESIDACMANIVGCPPGSDLGPLFGVIPFVIFGKLQTTSQTNFYDKSYGPYMSGAASFELFAEDFVVKDGLYSDPSYIGLLLDPGGTIYVSGRFQISAACSLEGRPVVVSASPTYISDGVADFVNGMTVGWDYKPQPQGVQSYEFQIGIDDAKSFANSWHHIMVSCD